MRTDDDDLNQAATRRNAVGLLGGLVAAPALMSAGTASAQGSAAAATRPEIAPLYVQLAAADTSYISGNVFGSTGGRPMG